MDELNSTLYSLIKNNTLPFLFIDLPYVSKLVFTYLFVKVFNKDESLLIKTYTKILNKESNDSFKIRALIDSKDNENRNNLIVVTSINKTDLSFFINNVHKFKDMLLQYLVYVGHVLHERMLIASIKEVEAFKELNLKMENIFKFNFKIVFPFEELSDEEQEIFNDVFETFDTRKYNITLEGIY